MRVPTCSTLAIILNDKNEVLFVLQKTGPFRGWWLLPGGRVEFGETVRDALIREVKEETGLLVKVSKLLGVFDVIYADQDCHFIHIVFLCERIGGELKAGSDASEVRWLDPNMLNETQTDLRRIMKATGFIED